MFDFFRNKRIDRYTFAVRGYINDVISAERKKAEESSRLQEQSSCISYSEQETDSEVRYSQREQDPDIRYSQRVAIDDNYDENEIKDILHNYSKNHSTIETLQRLGNCVDKTFVDGVMNIIRVKGYKDSDVYKAAYIDRRLFSKIMSNRQYKPSKDTAVAIAFALKLTTEQANDLLARAGYTLSHSSRRDIILEYFFKEKIYNLVDINEVLYNLNEKIIGR